MPTEITYFLRCLTSVFFFLVGGNDNRNKQAGKGDNVTKKVFVQLLLGGFRDDNSMANEIGLRVTSGTQFPYSAF